MKTIIIALLCSVCITCNCFGRHHHHGGHHHSHAIHHHGHHHHHGSWWGRGGQNFWPGFVGGVVAGSIINSAYTHRPIYVAPTVVQQTPVVVTPQPVYQQVWVEGRYIDQVQPNGTLVRVWQPGHYQQVQVR